MTLKRDWIPSPNYSSRGGSGVKLVIVHTAEGALTYEALGNFFASSSAGVSSHTGIDDKPGKIGEYVKRPNKAWTAGNANPYSVNVELCGFASWSAAEWERHPNMLDNCARWIAEECKYYGIPIKKSNQHGVCGHVDVSGPGGHWDPGPNFPWDRVLDAAKSGGPVYGGGGTAPPPDTVSALPVAAPGSAPLAAQIAIMEVDVPPEYIIKDTSEGFVGSGNFYACFPSGLVRRVVEAERNAMNAGQTGGPPIIQAKLTKESSNLYTNYDQALRGLYDKR